MQVQLYVSLYSLDVVATSREIFLFVRYAIIGWPRVEDMDEGRRKNLALRGPRGIFYRYFSCSPSLILLFSFFIYLFIYFFLPFFLQTPLHGFSPGSPSGREDRADYNQRAHKSASIVLFSPPACLSIFSKADDEKEDKLVGKSFRCCANTPAGESAGWPSRGGRFGVACGRRGC